MRTKFLFMILCVLTIVSCSNIGVKIRGDVKGLKGKVTLSTKFPGTNELKVIDEQDVSNGKINLSTSELIIPAEVVVDIDGKRSITIIVDTEDQIWIEGKINFPAEIVALGSVADTEYAKIMETVEAKYQSELDELNDKILDLQSRETLSKNGKVALQIAILRKHSKTEAMQNYIEKLVLKNLDRETSMLLIKNELSDKPELQHTLFNQLTIANKDSFLYKSMAESFNPA